MSDASATSPSSSSFWAPREAEEESSSNVAASKAFLQQKRREHLTHILRSLDIIVYLHLSYMYFLDCSFFRFFLRAAAQFLFLTPKLINLPLPPHSRSPVIALAAASAYAVLMHLWGPNPVAGELTHGYLHGGLIIDFIGQEGPISKPRLLYVDAVIILLQLAMLSLVVARQELLPSPTPPPPAPQAQAQDVESEERGEIRPALSETLNDRHSENGIEVEAAELERSVFEVNAGEFVVARMDIVAAVRRQWGGDPQPQPMQTRRDGDAAPNWRVLMRANTGAWRR